jgi:carboxyl-terminal processing protease
VVIDAGSASAAEALAGALQAHGRARLYGQTTFGKGLVHATLPIADAGIAMFPTGQLRTPDGRLILGSGLQPDVRTVNPLTRAGSDLAKSRRRVDPVGARQNDCSCIICTPAIHGGRSAGD